MSIENSVEIVTKPHYDFMFKKICKDEEVLRPLVAEILNVNLDNLTAVEFVDTEFTKDDSEGKTCRVDILVTVNNQVINLELNVAAQTDYKDRSLLYAAKIFARGLAKNKKYGEVTSVICVNFIDFELFEYAKFHGQFQMLELENHTLLSKKLL
ncbi:hypothetical protein FACS1894132_12540 [Clostridia bacterium]|nr:hypothetical protein FACS1894132_12540 [Clostridia bacterium]